MSKKRKTYNPAEKAKIVLEALREGSTMEIAESLTVMYIKKINDIAGIVS
jgi:transposase-like protein